MMRDEADELVRDLERTGVQVEAIEPRPWHDGEYQLYCWCPDPAHFSWIVDAEGEETASAAPSSD